MKRMEKATVFEQAALWLSQLAADVANYSDHAEHNEAVDRVWVVKAAAELRQLSLSLGQTLNCDVVQLYAQRLDGIERRHVAWDNTQFNGAAAASKASTWRALQLVQLEHDRVYHPDVLGLSKAHQLQHYALHLIKITGAFARAVDDKTSEEEVFTRRLADVLLFGLKLSTVMGETLDESPLPTPNSLSAPRDIAAYDQIVASLT
jgi:hypothetical protein